VPLDAATEWVLARAFAQREGPAPLGLVPEEAARRARCLGLAARIAGRAGGDRLRRELGAAAAPLVAERTAAAAQGILHEELLREAAQAAAELRLPVALLKGAALALTGAAPAATRPAADVDLLVPPAGAAALQRTLLRRGWEDAGGRGYEQHLPPLRRPGRGILELHTSILGVRFAGRRRSVGHGELARAGHLAALDGLPGECAVPSRPVLVAHALVHGLAQHGLAPRAYAGALVMADLLDLEFVGEPGNRLAAEIRPWIADSLSTVEQEAALELAGRLADGDADWLRAAGGGPPARRLLDHVLAGALDARYARGLRLRALSLPLSDRPVAARLDALAAVLVTRGRRLFGGGARGIAR
jgi:hypothetical protein